MSLTYSLTDISLFLYFVSVLSKSCFFKIKLPSAYNILTVNISD